MRYLYQYTFLHLKIAKPRNGEKCVNTCIHIKCRIKLRNWTEKHLVHRYVSLLQTWKRHAVWRRPDHMTTFEQGSQSSIKHFAYLHDGPFKLSLKHLHHKEVIWNRFWSNERFIRVQMETVAQQSEFHIPKRNDLLSYLTYKDNETLAAS